MPADVDREAAACLLTVLGCRARQPRQPSHKPDEAGAGVITPHTTEEARVGKTLSHLLQLAQCHGGQVQISRAGSNLCSRSLHILPPKRRDSIDFAYRRTERRQEGRR